MYHYWKSIIFIALWFAIINAVFAVAADIFSVLRPIINAEYLVLLLLGLRWRRLALLLLCIWVLPNEIYPIVKQFLPNAELLDYLGLIGNIQYANRQMQLLMLFGLVCCAGAAVTFDRLPRQRSAIGVLALPVAVLFIVNSLYQTGIWTATPRFDFRGTALEPYFRQGRIVALNSLYQQREAPHGWDILKKIERRHKGSALPAAISPIIANADRLLLIVNESWGVADSAALQQKIISPIVNNPRFAARQQGEFIANNLTVVGELRVLCGEVVSAGQFHFQGDYENCLPKRLQDKGYSTYAFHAATDQMYGRAAWYQRAGFQQRVFYEDRIWPRKCHSFPGACDADMAQEIARELAASPKQLLYWLTLNTHYPFDSRDLSADYPQLDCTEFDVQGDSCRLAQLQYQFFQVLAQLLANERAEGFSVVVIGDHAAFARAEKSSVGFSQKKASWLAFSVSSAP